MSCSGSSSTIKRGYWFGVVSGKSTVTFCPINYCNFSCCETTSGYYHLSPVRDNQCVLHRSGTACSSCDIGYTLSFDSAECIPVKACTIEQTILLVALIILYWIAITVAVFVMMYRIAGNFRKVKNIPVNMISKKYFRKHLNQHHFEIIFSKILQTMCVS